MDRFDVHDAAFAEDPWSTYAALRRAGPVHWSETVRAFILTRHADVYRALRDPDMLTDFAFRLNHRLFGRCLLDLDGSAHVEARRALAPVFGGAGIRDVVDPIIADGVALLFEDAPATPDAAFAARLAADLPYYLTTRLLGLPFSDREWLRPRVGAIARSIELPEVVSGPEAVAAAQELFDYVADHADAAAAAPLGALLAADAPPWAGWTHHGTVVFFLLAGTETTTCVVANVLRALLLHGVGFARLADDQRLLEAVVKETLRWDPPTHTVLRFARDDVTIGGVRIPRHSRVLLCLAGANRDPEAFPDPDAWRPERPSGRSLSFGAGAHACLGARTAQREVAALLSALAAHAGDLDPEHAIGPSTGNSFRRPSSLDFSFLNHLQKAAS